MAVSTDAAVLQSVLTANSGRNNRNENMKYGAYSNFLHEKCSCIPQEAPWKGTNSSCFQNHENLRAYLAAFRLFGKERYYYARFT